MARPQILYINLAHRPDRRASLEHQFQTLGLSGERVEAVTPKELSGAAVRRYCRPHRRIGIEPYELACAESHLRALRTFLEGGSEHALILEDDAVLSRALPNFLDAFVAAGVGGIVKIDVVEHRLRLSDPRLVLAGRFEFRRLFSKTYSACGYLLDRAAAVRLLDHRDILLRRPVDWAIFDPYSRPGNTLSILQVIPALVTSLDKLPDRSHPAARTDILGRAYERRPGTVERLERLPALLAEEVRSGLAKFVQDYVWRIGKHEVPFARD